MAYAMTKQGSLDNCVTYEFICDTLADMNAIENKYRTIGSVAVVLQGESGMEAYIAGSDKQWNNLGTMGASGSGSTSSNLSIYTCAQNEVSNGKPNIASPDENTIYLVSAGNESGNLYEEYIYVNNAWEKFGAASIDLSGYAPIANPAFTGSISLGRKANTTTGNNSIALGNNTVASGLYSFAEGTNTTASNQNSHAEGFNTRAEGIDSHAEGENTIALGWDAHAEGRNNQVNITLNNTTYSPGARGEVSHSEGINTSASGYASHAEGTDTVAYGTSSHTEGYQTLATGNNAHAEGIKTKAIAFDTHAEGNGENNTNDKITIAETVYDIGAYGHSSHIEGITTGTGSLARGAHAEGVSTFAIGEGAHSEGNQTVASGNMAHAEGYKTLASSTHAHSEGQTTTASGTQSHAEGLSTIASGVSSHAEGYGGTYTTNNVSYTSGAKGVSDHTEGYQCLTANAQPGNHAEGYRTQATGGAAHAEGNRSIASGPIGSHAEGNLTIASAGSAHAEGTSTTASGQFAHAEGLAALASGEASHAEGKATKAQGNYSHTEGDTTIAVGSFSHVSGTYNVEDSYANWNEWTANTDYRVGDKVKRTTISNNTTTIKGYICKYENNDSIFTSSHWRHLEGQMNFAEIVGNGYFESRTNARALDWDGNEYLSGDLYVGCRFDSTGGSKVATEAFVTTRVPTPPVEDGTYILQVSISSGTPTYSWVSLATLSGVTF